MNYIHFERMHPHEKKRRNDLRKKEQAKLERYFEDVAKLYNLPHGVDFLDITDKLMRSHLLLSSNKKEIVKFNRRIVVFNYVSDGLRIKGTISFTPDSHLKKTIIYLRGGNNLFALPHPASDITCHKDYTIITTTLRGGVSEGRDEFGGNDVNDVKNLIDYLPELSRKLKSPFQINDMILLGGSRGAMEMFLFLSRFQEYQPKFQKAISFSGLVDLEKTLEDRDDMLEMFKEDFGYLEGDLRWIKYRNPINHASNIHIPVILIQGDQDLRVSLDEAKNMEKALKKAHVPVYLHEVLGGSHLLSNHPNRMKVVEEMINKNNLV